MKLERAQFDFDYSETIMKTKESYQYLYIMNYKLNKLDNIYDYFIQHAKIK